MGYILPWFVCKFCRLLKEAPTSNFSNWRYPHLTPCGRGHCFCHPLHLLLYSFFIRLSIPVGKLLLFPLDKFRRLHILYLGGKNQVPHVSIGHPFITESLSSYRRRRFRFSLNWQKYHRLYTLPFSSI